MDIRKIFKKHMNNLKSMIYNSIKGANKMKKSYTIIIHKEENPIGYWAECREIKGCFAQAKTIDEVKALMKQCIIMKLEEDKQITGQTVEEIDLQLSYA